jgi:hypothetical protein
MKLESQVVSLELAKKLKELGVEQDSLFYWYLSENANYDITENKYKNDYSFTWSAFTASELGEIIGNSFNEWAQGWNDSYCQYYFQWGPRGAGSMIEGIGKSGFIDCDDEEELTEVNARAKILIHLIENKLITLDKS